MKTKLLFLSALSVCLVIMNSYGQDEERMFRLGYKGGMSTFSKAFVTKI